MRLGLACVLLGLWPTVTSPKLALAAEQAFVNSLGMKFVRIEPGTFRMGQDGPPADYRMLKHPDKFDDADWDETPTHGVTLTRPIMMATTEVTNAQYEQFEPTRKDLRLKARVARGGDEPVVNVSWDDAVAFCAWLSKREGRPYRLPTEAEWEHACRAGTTTLFHTGDSLPPGFQKWVEPGRRRLYFPEGPLPREFRDPTGEFPLTVGTTAVNNWGLFDMHGNVEEWCLDWYGPYETPEEVDPVGRVDGDFRVTRGGAHSQLTRMLRSANRSGRTPDTRNIDIGFRVVQADAPVGRPLPSPQLPLNKRDVRQDAGPAARQAPAEPVFRGPSPFVKISARSDGPLFSRHNHSPAVVECPNGDLLAVWFSCAEEPGSELCVAAGRLRVGSNEWEASSPFWDGPDVNDHFPKLWFDGERALYFFVRGHDGNQVMTSVDNGVTWSRPRPIGPPGELGNLPFRTREGFIVVPHDGSSGLVMSRDNGATWTFPLGRGQRSDCKPGVSGSRCSGIHNGMAQLADGSLLAFGRNDEPDIQESFGGRMSLTTTNDWGNTWQYAVSPFPVISSTQRPVMLRLREGPLLFVSFTDQVRHWNNRKGMTFRDANDSEYTGYGMFLALSNDDGKSWPVQKLMTNGGPDRQVKGTDGGLFTLGPTTAERNGYLTACQTRDGMIQLLSSRNHYVFNLAWAQQPPAIANK